MDNSQIIESYSRLKNLHLVAREIGIPWQTVYVRLRGAGISVTGDKKRYGSETDKLAAKGEAIFQRMVPFAENQNDTRWQPEVDFIVRGMTVDVKTSRLTSANYKFKSKRWGFSLKKQQLKADFFVCLALNESSGEVEHLLLIPGEMVRDIQTVSLSQNPNGKWLRFKISADDLRGFFEAVSLSAEP